VYVSSMSVVTKLPIGDCRSAFEARLEEMIARMRDSSSQLPALSSISLVAPTPYGPLATTSTSLRQLVVTTEDCHITYYHSPGSLDHLAIGRLRAVSNVAARRVYSSSVHNSDPPAGYSAPTFLFMHMQHIPSPCILTTAHLRI
jgi:hypothetical protein